MKQKTNGAVSKMTEEQEMMRLQVVDLELKARYWKAQHDIRYFTLAAESLQEEYEKYLQEQEVKRNEAMENLQKELERLNTEEQSKLDEIKNVEENVN
jgi:predicted  nucleic acid-binding Zn-ribbon protein